MTGTIDHVAGGVRWALRPDLFERHDELFGPDGLRLASWVADGRAVVLKQAGHRSIYRVTLNGLDFHLKRYPVSGVAAWLKQLVRPSRARAEYDRALALAGLGVPAVEALAVGEPRRGIGPSYLLTRTVPHSQALSEFFEKDLPSLPPERQTRVRQRLARELGLLLAKMHAAGAVHDDLHPANILLRLVDDEPLLCLVDLLEVRLGTPLGDEARYRNLTVFNRWFALRSNRTDRLRFWRAYEIASAVPAVDLEGRTLDSNRRFWLQQDRRCLANNRYFRRVRAGAVSGHAVADLPAEELAALAADPDEPFRRDGVIVLKHSPSSSVIEMELGGRRVVYKRFAVTTRSDPWAALFRPTPALRSFVMGHGLRLRGLPTPRPLAVLHRRRHGLPYEGYLLVEKVPDARELLKFVAEVADKRERLRKLIDDVARLIRTLHERHLSQRDLKAANLLVSSSGWSLARSAKVWLAEGTTAETAVWFIDLVGITRHRQVSYARRIQNLVRLHASFVHHSGLTRTDKLRFLRMYLAWGLHGKAGWKKWWRDIAAGTSAKIERNQQRGRVLG